MLEVEQRINNSTLGKVNLRLKGKKKTHVFHMQPVLNVKHRCIFFSPAEAVQCTHCRLKTCCAKLKITLEAQV